jgi:hypothetical protein
MGNNRFMIAQSGLDTDICATVGSMTEERINDKPQMPRFMKIGIERRIKFGGDMIGRIQSSKRFPHTHPARCIQIARENVCGKFRENR